ncbi:maleylacetoacetate isomerase [Solirhodobacter olei]|uniref:maleylacetoacetate isomerase n=1 Tax=Solirhodobacter olei TaxID=2493082 RepID=UPI000FD9CD85|nr:maleylacetoacetate isomerase [Solirhodobacter olei]
MTILYDYWRSSAAYRVRIGLGLAGIAHERVAVNLLTGENRQPAHLARNPQGLVPALEIDGQMLTQSLAILEYLDETRAAGFLPKDPAGRARVRALAYAVAMEIHPVCNSSVARFAVEASAGAITTEAWMAKFIPRGMAALEEMLNHPGTGRFCHGESVSLADICLVPQLYNARRWGIDPAPWRRCLDIEARLLALPAVAAAHPDHFNPETP